MAGERGRKKRGAQETHQSGTDQEVAKSPPFVSRYPKRTSRGVLPHLSSPSSRNAREIVNPNPCQSRSLKPAIPHLNEAKVIPKPDPVGENYEIKLSPWTQSPSCPAPYSQHEIYQLEGTQEVPPQSQNKNGHSLPPMENGAVSRAVGAEVVQEKSTANDMNVYYLLPMENDAVSSAVGAEVGQEKSMAKDMNMDYLVPKENDAVVSVSRAVGAEVVQEKSRAKDMIVDYLLPMKNDVVLRAEDVQEKITANDVPRSGQCLSPSHSLNFTEFARANQDDSDDPDEVKSAPGLSHDIVHGHQVKKEMAPLLRDIFQKYGDITVETSVKPPKYISFLLEELCDVYQKLETTKLTDLTHVEIAEMVEQLQYMESQKINARWLLKKVEEIAEVKISLQNYSMFKDKEKKCIEQIREKQEILKLLEKHVAAIQKKYKVVTRAMEESEAEANECRKMRLDIKARVNDDVLKKPLVHGLL